MGKITAAFQEAYRQLNKEQKIAVNTIDGPVMVIAGPGTGKTQTVALRIANILLKTDTPPDAILALTFTESATRAMRERLLSLIGQTAYYVHITTFHSFCSDVIRTNPDRFTLDSDAEPLSELESIKIFHSILDSNRFDMIKPVNAPYLYTRELVRAIRDLKREGISPEIFAKVIENWQSQLEKHLKSKELTKSKYDAELRRLGKNRELLFVYRLYQDHVQDIKRFDFEDMINFVSDKFRSDKELLSLYQERYHYFLVDEYQDTNSAQNTVVELLAGYWGESANIFVVGDPSQSIFRFQGASLENTLNFLEKHSQATVISLVTNYRSSQTILDAAHELISHNRLKIQDFTKLSDPRLLSTQDGNGSMLQIAELPSSISENIYISQSIKSLLDLGSLPSEIAVIYRKNKDAVEIAEMLTRLGVSYVIQGGGNVLEDPIIRQLLKIFQVIHKMRTLDDDLDLFTVLHYEFFGLLPLDILKLTRLASSKRLSLFEVMSNPKILESSDVSEPQKFTDLVTLFTKWEADDSTNTFVKFFEIVMNESGYLNWILARPDAQEKVAKLNALFAEIKRMNVLNRDLDLRHFLADFAVMELNNIKIQEPVFDLPKDAVVLTTAHSAKGLEWEHVFITKAFDTQWGNNRSFELIKLPENLLLNSDLSKKEKNEDERRLFYVALTRAKKVCTITYSKTYASGGNVKEVVPSMFLSEIPDTLKSIASTENLASEVQTRLIDFLKPVEIRETSPEEMNFLQKAIRNFRLSSTALNSYLECPYKFKLNNLLKVPRAKAPYFSFGSAVHTALEHFYTRFNEEGALPEAEFLLAQFESALATEILTKRDFEERLVHGKKLLTNYYSYYKDQFTPSLYIEKFFGYGRSPIYIDDVPLVGKVDRIEWADSDHRTVRVIDYKTGAPKTRGEIEGTTKYSDGGYKRQLVFYRLLIDNDKWFKPKFAEAELDFIQPDSRGKYRKERFTITDNEASELKSTIKQVSANIRALKFDCTHNQRHCEGCEFFDHCWPHGFPKTEMGQLPLINQEIAR